MQKKIIALAVAGLVSGAAFAQSNVTVYGVVDAGYAYVKSDPAAAGATKKFSGVEAGGDWGSRLGFRGEEDLGNGLKAVFNLEFGSLGVDKGTGMESARNTVVGLSSKSFGTFLIGKQQSAAENFGAAMRPMGSFVDVQDIANMAFGANIRGAADRLDNTISYTSPNFAGFVARASYSFSGETETNNGTVDTSGTAIAHLQYTNGPLDVAAVYRGTSSKTGTSAIVSGNTVNTVVAGREGKDEWGIRGAYDFKVVRLGLGYQDQSVDGTEAVGYRDGKQWVAFATAPVGANGLLMAEYGKASGDSTATLGKAGGKGWAVGYKHNLSKRTHLYTWYGEIKASEDIALRNKGVDIESGDKSQALQLGLKHSF